MGFELVDIQVSSSKNKTILRLFIDGLNNTTDRCNVTTVDCEKASRAIENILSLEETSEVYKNMCIEVSTPGIERKLNNISDYVRFNNWKCKVTYLSKEDNEIKSDIFTIVNIEGNNVVFDKNNQKIVFAIEEIKKAKLRY